VSDTINAFPRGDLAASGLSVVKIRVASICKIGADSQDQAQSKEGSVMSEKKYIVRLTDSERKVCADVIGKLKGTGQKVRRAQMLLKADADGPAWTDAQIADAFSCRTKTVENVRQRFVNLGFEQTLNRKKSPTAGAKKLLNGNEEARIIAMRLGSPPQGYGQWTLRLLARKVVELEVVQQISHETVRQTLKKTA
jgi:hypothetical protein